MIRIIAAIAVVTTTFFVGAQRVDAGAQFIPAFRIGSCGTGPGAPDCEWSCSQGDPTSAPFCQGGGQCDFDVTETFSALLVMRVDDTPCGSAGGAVLEIGLRGEKQDQTVFTIPSRTIDLCGVNSACGGCDENVCSPSDNSCPLENIFHCERSDSSTPVLESCELPAGEEDERRFCEIDVTEEDMAGWLTAGTQPLLGPLRSDLGAQFPSEDGLAIIFSAQELSVEDNSANAQPSVGEYCVQVAFLEDNKSTPIPAEVVAAAASMGTSSLAPGNGCLLCGNGSIDGDEECDDGNIDDGDGCDAACHSESTGGCLQAIDESGCVTGFAKGALIVQEKAPGKEKLVAKLLKGPALEQTDMGDPLDPGGTSYSLCIYDASGNLAGQASVDRAGDTCAGKPCWKPVGKAPTDPNGPGKGYKYKDANLASDGIKKLLYKGGDVGKSKAIVKGKGANLPAGIPAALQNSPTATVQLRASDGQCLSVTLNSIKQEPDFFKAK